MKLLAVESGVAFAIGFSFYSLLAMQSTFLARPGMIIAQDCKHHQGAD